MESLQIDTPLFCITLLFYVAAASGYVAYLLQKTPPPEGLLLAGFVVHSACILLRFVNGGEAPATNPSDAQIFLSWVLVASYLIMQSRRKMFSVGAFIVPVSIGLLLSGLLDTGGPVVSNKLSSLLPSFWMPVHVSFAFLGDSLLLLSACFAGMYLLQRRQLKVKRTGSLYYLFPSLDTLDRLSYLCTRLGFCLLTVGILTGVIWMKTSGNRYIDWADSRQTASILIWFLYAALIHGRFSSRWTDRRMAWLNIFGVCLILGAFLNLPHFME